MLNYVETPVKEIYDDLFDRVGISVYVKHEELNHPTVSGNKWWKLKYNLERAKNLNYDTVLTFGGAYSNHVYATAAAASEYGFKSIGVIRGEETRPLNSTLTFASACGMQLHYISREAYRIKKHAPFLDELKNKWGHFYLIPEGGTNDLAVKGCAEFASEKLNFDFDYLCLPVGTGGTLAGMVAGLPESKSVIGFAVLKGGDFLKDDVRELVKKFSDREYSNWSIQTDYHFGGYARFTPKLMQFISRMEQQHHLRLDHVYTGKLMAGVYDLIEKSYFKRGSRVLILHTGGLR
jgi:1-aminocyclopropane-1-carboxylate deaminase